VIFQFPYYHTYSLDNIEEENRSGGVEKNQLLSCLVQTARKGFRKEALQSRLGSQEGFLQEEALDPSQSYNRFGCRWWSRRRILGAGSGSDPVTHFPPR
jgi:hypothetical protein